MSKYKVAAKKLTQGLADLKKALEETKKNPEIIEIKEDIQNQMNSLSEKQEELNAIIKKLSESITKSESSTEAASAAASAAITRWGKAKQWMANNPWKTAGTALAISSGSGRWALDKVLKTWNWSPDSLKSEEAPKDITQVSKVVVEDPIDKAIQQANQQVQKPSVNYNAIDSLFMDYK